MILTLKYPSSCTVRMELIIKLKHMSHVTYNCYMFAALCKVNEDNFKSNIIMYRLINLLYTEIHKNSHGVFTFFVTLEHIFRDSYP